MDNIVDVLKIEVDGESKKAVDSIDNLIGVLEKIKGVTGDSNKGLNRITKNLDKLDATLSKIDSGNAAKLKDLADGLQGLSGLSNLRLPTKVAERIVDIGAAVDCLKGVDFSKLQEMASGLTALQGLGNVNVPHFDNTSSSPETSLTGASSLSDSSVLDAKAGSLSPAIEETRSALSQLSNDLDKNRSLWTDLGNIGRSALQRIDTALTPLKTKVLGTAFSVPLKPLKSLGNMVGKATSKVGEFFTMFKKRALYRAINGIISAITTGFKEGTANVYQYSKALGGTLSSSLDSISTSFLYFKNSIGAAVAPLINMLAPAIEYIIDKCVALLNVLNQVFAKLSGASTWTKAVKYPTEYAKAADSAKSANEKLKKSILGIDEINPLSDNSSGGGGGGGGGDMDYSSMFEEAELGEINNPFADFFAPFKAAWENEGQNTINAIKTAFENVKGMLVSIGSSFKEVWTNGTGQQTVETILRIVQNIVTCVGNLASSFQKAWDNAGTGTKIVQGLWDIFNDLLSFMEGFYGITADWLGSLDLSPLLTSVSGVIAAFEPLVDLIGGTLLWLYETVLLPIAKWAIEEAAPASIDAITAALEMLHAFLEPFLAGFQQLWESLQPIIDWVESVVIVIIDGVRSIFEKCAKVFQEKGKKIQEIVSGIGDIISVVWGVVEPIFNLLKDVVGNVFSFIGDIISTVVGFVIDLFHGLIEFVAGVFTGDWSRAWNGIKGIFVGIWDAIKGVALAIWDFLKGLWNSMKDNVQSIWNGIKSFLTNLWNGIKTTATNVWNGLKTAVMNVVNGIKSGITTAFNAVKTFMTNLWNGIKTTTTNVWNGILKAIKGVINGILGGVEGMVNGVIKGLNLMINALNKLSFDVPDWVPAIGGKKFGFNIKNISEVRLPRLADGGMVNAGTAFIAGEAGAEVVANIGKRTGVMNTDQMRESVEQGVMDANAEQNALLREEISILRKILDKDTPSSGYGGARSIISDIERKNRRDGKTVIPVGV